MFHRKLCVGGELLPYLNRTRPEAALTSAKGGLFVVGCSRSLAWRDGAISRPGCTEQPWGSGAGNRAQGCVFVMSDSKGLGSCLPVFTSFKGRFIGKCCRPLGNNNRITVMVLSKLSGLRTYWKGLFFFPPLWSLKSDFEIFFFFFYFGGQRTQVPIWKLVLTNPESLWSLRVM